MANEEIRQLVLETALRAADRVILQEGTNRATAATLALLGALEHSDEAPTTGNVTGVVGTLHWIDASGITADRDFVLPASAQVGERCAVGIAASHASNQILVKTADDIDKINGNDGNFNTNPYAALSAAGNVWLFRCVSAANPDWVLEVVLPALPGNHIRGMLYSFVDAGTVQVAVGEIMINGVLFRHPAATNVDQLATAGADTIYFLYAVNNAGVLGFEFSTTRGTFNEELGYFTQGTDKDKRRIGSVSEDASNNIRRFRTTQPAENLVTHYYANNEFPIILNAGQSQVLTGGSLANIGAWEALLADDADQFYLVLQAGWDAAGTTGQVRAGVGNEDITYSSAGRMWFSHQPWAEETQNVATPPTLFENPGAGNEIFYAVQDTGRQSGTGSARLFVIPKGWVMRV